MRKSHITNLVCMAVVSATAVACAEPSVSAATPAVRTVHPGQSIQAAVDAARTGDTIVVEPGTYHESVLIKKQGLTLRGTGAKTVIKPASTGTKTGNACAKAGSGVCVLGTSGHTVDGVSIRSLTVSGFKKNGIWASWTDGLKVRQVTSDTNGVWGIAQERSTRSELRSNTAHGNGDSRHLRREHRGRRGWSHRHPRDAAPRQHADEQPDRHHRPPGPQPHRPGQHRHRQLQRHVRRRRRGQAAGRGDDHPQQPDHRQQQVLRGDPRLPAIQGSGIVLTGTVDTKVRDNTIRNNVGATPLSGGLVLFKSFVGAHNTGNTISRNVVLGNRPADLANQEAGRNNTFVGNTCATSAPTGMC